MRILNKTLYILSIIGLMLVLSLTVLGADGDKTRELLSDGTGRVVAVSHRGDTALYPANSLEAIISAREKGADAVSVAVSSTKDGVYVLCEDIALSNVCNTAYTSVSQITWDELKGCALYDSFGNLTEYRIVTLEEALEKLGGEIYLILDIAWEQREGIYALYRDSEYSDCISLRSDVSASEVAGWADSGADVIGIYKGNIIWNSIGHINKLSEKGMLMAEYRTKNYFNVCYGTVVGNNFSAEGKVRAVVSAYDPDLCGKRSDSAEGWNELINDGFTVIETNNIEGLSAYISETEGMKKSLKDLAAQVHKADMEKYSSVSKENIEYALVNADDILEGRAVSLSEVQKAYSSLVFSLNEKRVTQSGEETEGALNITTGKVAVVVLIGCALFAAQVFVYKKHKRKKI